MEDFWLKVALVYGAIVITILILLGLAGGLKYLFTGG
jgi:hypothetical protein